MSTYRVKTTFSSLSPDFNGLARCTDGHLVYDGDVYRFSWYVVAETSREAHEQKLSTLRHFNLQDQNGTSEHPDHLEEVIVSADARALG